VKGNAEPIGGVLPRSLMFPFTPQGVSRCTVNAYLGSHPGESFLEHGSRTLDVSRVCCMYLVEPKKHSL